MRPARPATPPRPTTQRLKPLRSTALLVALAAATATACSSAPAQDAPAADTAVTLDNCGRKITVAEPPKRAVALNQGSAEIMYALGLQDRMVGTATWTDPVLPEYAAANEKVPRLADNAPSFERVLEAEPDFVAASFESVLGTGGVATRDQFEQLGVPTYLSPTDCGAKDNSGDGDGVRTTPLTMDDVYGEIRDLAKVFGVAQRGDDLVASLQQRMSAATDGLKAEGVDLMFWFANSEAPYMGGCCGAPGVVVKALGAGNSFQDTREEWPQINWEAVAERDPDVLVIGDLTRRSQTAETGAAKIAFLESNPVTAQMTAVKEKRYVLLTGQAMNPTMRTVGAVETVAQALRRFGLGG
ncbi:ABC transporter substrate-binding protein [Actinosynnema pretiosum subsp. pretiosum]|uniref:ABC transporter substrate-binding protein n=1 Tax=Actinosynnema pretiosum subsp. pretiosum TaxID=103721 RepID=A0AA45R5E1_9PSEU|nr:ABC transporter (iron.B12.siderophore.hemin), periplasmic substrate-binding component [Actinosynnema pretiosum subsp. pretiosum]QUF05734.1 ABC transporter substrate-binding protein [Actinosynnema pretiosum subsp. pretiosum]